MPWPTQKAMQQVYEEHLWGGAEFDFYSGTGSHEMTIVKPYLDVMIRFLNGFPELLSVVDLGCGDFNVGKELLSHVKSYTAIDIVPDLIKRNQLKYRFDHLNFICLDIAKDQLPKGDCAIIRQVLQHLSNDEIKQVVNQLSQYRFVILTEHIPEGEFEPNKDIISGQGIRLKKNSGVDLFMPPFDLQNFTAEVIQTVPYLGGKGIIQTWLIRS
ncbi:MAG: class I SAM-dependent methyltransferase [Flavobacteriales bacterium]|nr:class I SAM-dependent methyltransferase [Flavobacteriales bacterium]